MARPDSPPEALSGESPAAAQTGERPMFVEGETKLAPGRIYDFAKLHPGNRIAGPAVVHSAITTVVVQTGQTAQLDAWRNLVIEAA